MKRIVVSSEVYLHDLPVEMYVTRVAKLEWHWSIRTITSHHSSSSLTCNRVCRYLYTFFLVCLQSSLHGLSCTHAENRLLSLLRSTAVEEIHSEQSE